MISELPQWALLTGILLSFILPESWNHQTQAKLWSGKLLQLSVILLGASLNFHSILEQGTSGALVTFISILLVFFAGFISIKLFNLDKKLGILLTMGTAICGGSAIGALAPVIGAEASTITIAMASVFLLNAAAVFIFPYIGDILLLTQEQFGIWSALAIHDTSSVVAASSIYGTESLKIAATLKLTRALWIIPITLLFSIFWKKENTKAPIPWFVLGFLGTSILFTFIEPLKNLSTHFILVSKIGFAVTLLLIGSTFDMKRFKAAGIKPFLYSLILWTAVSAGALFYVRF